MHCLGGAVSRRSWWECIREGPRYSALGLRCSAFGRTRNLIHLVKHKDLNPSPSFFLQNAECPMPKASPSNAQRTTHPSPAILEPIMDTLRIQLHLKAHLGV